MRNTASDTTTIQITRSTQQELLERIKHRFAKENNMPEPVCEALIFRKDYDKEIQELLKMAKKIGA